jgi:iron complex outermembrane receptor protein
MRASFATSKRGAYLTNGQDNEDTKSLRLRALLQPIDNFAFTITGELSNNQGSGFGGGVVAFGDESEVDNPWVGVQSDNKSKSDQTTKKISGQINWDTGIGTLVLTPSYSTRKGSSEEVRGGFAGMEESLTYMEQSANEKGLEARMTSDPDFLFKWIAGATYYRSEDGQRLDSEEFVTTGTGSWSDRIMTNKNRAVFANITYPIMDSFRLTAGYRKSWDTMISDNEEMRGALPGSGLPPGTLEYALEHSEMSTDGSPDYKLGFEYDLGPNSMVYADYSTSYRVRGMGGGGPPGGGPGGGTRPIEGQEGAGSTNSDDPEKLKAYTLGAKNRFFENKLQINIAAYYYDYKNYRAGGNDVMAWLWDLDNDLIGDQSNPQEVYREPYANGSGNGRMIGVDISSSAVLTPKDMVSLSVSYIKSEWTDLRMVYYYPYTLVVVDEPTPHTEPVPQLGADFSGKPMMSTPPWNINLTYDHTFSLWNGGSIRASLSTKYKTEYRLSWRDSDYPINFQESYHMEDVNIVYNNPDGKWNLSTYVKNITNYAEKRMIMNAGGAKLLSIGNPRTYGGVLSVKF